MDNHKVGDVIELGLILPGIRQPKYKNIGFTAGTLRPCKYGTNHGYASIYVMADDGEYRVLHNNSFEGIYEREVKIVARMRIKSLKS